MTKIWLMPVAWALAGHVLAADNCESLRGEIESKIRANGVTQFSVTVVDADTAVEGQVVGTCGQDSRKIVYRREGAGGASAVPQPPAAAAAAGERIITECKDGTVSVGGGCRP